MTQQITMLTKESLAKLAEIYKPPLLSLYQPTHRKHPENRQDQILFGNLIKALASSLQQQYSDSDTMMLLEPFNTLANDHDFWSHTLEGMAVLGGSNIFQVFKIQRSVSELAVVGDNFYTKPLRRILQSDTRYQVLGLSLSKIQLFEGGRNALYEIDPALGVPLTITEALGDKLIPQHDHSGENDEVDNDSERFFRTVDQAVLEHHSRPSGLPLILAALPEHHHLFHKVSHNPFLMQEGLSINPDALKIDELWERAWQIVEPQYQVRLATLVEDFALAESKQLGSDDVSQVAQAAATGRVASLLLESNRQIAGRLNRETGQITVGDLGDPQVDDLLDDIGELVVKMGGEVIVIQPEQMPGQTGLAGIYRY